MPAFAQRERRGSVIDIAPLVDIVFLLLIFFMISSRFLKPVVELELPEAKTADRADRSGVVLSLDASGSVFLDGGAAAIDFDDLPGALKAAIEQKNRTDVLLRADGATPFRYFVRVMDEARQAGATTVNIEHEARR